MQSIISRETTELNHLLPLLNSFLLWSIPSEIQNTKIGIRLAIIRNVQKYHIREAKT
jgi:hypothetical protein